MLSGHDSYYFLSTSLMLGERATAAHLYYWAFTESISNKWLLSWKGFENRNEQKEKFGVTCITGILREEWFASNVQSSS